MIPIVSLWCWYFVFICKKLCLAIKCIFFYWMFFKILFRIQIVEKVLYSQFFFQSSFFVWCTHYHNYRKKIDIHIYFKIFFHLNWKLETLMLGCRSNLSANCQYFVKEKNLFLITYKPFLLIDHIMSINWHTCLQLFCQNLFLTYLLNYL